MEFLGAVFTYHVNHGADNGLAALPGTGSAATAAAVAR